MRLMMLSSSRIRKASAKQTKKSFQKYHDKVLRIRLVTMLNNILSFFLFQNFTVRGQTILKSTRDEIEAQLERPQLQEGKNCALLLLL